jgi:DMSO/TMAO reductase YedYZ molybdopterin-dependent catalytic subunit
MLNEVTQYQGQTLTTINTYIQYLYAHPDVAIKGVQNIDPSTYRLAITGMVNSPKSLTYDQVVNGFNPQLEVATLPCVEGWSITVLWQGVAITDLLDYTAIDPGANTIIFKAADDYTSSLPLDYIKENNLMIAYRMNNITLTPQLGWPFFLVATNQYGYKWVEWITEINVSNDSSYLGFWESRGYPNNATVRTVGGGVSVMGENPVAVWALGVSMVVIAGVAVWYVRRRRLRHSQFSSGFIRGSFNKH